MPKWNFKAIQLIVHLCREKTCKIPRLRLETTTQKKLRIAFVESILIIVWGNVFFTLFCSLLRLHSVQCAQPENVLRILNSKRIINLEKSHWFQQFLSIN